jgi:hypothetical protein
MSSIRRERACVATFISNVAPAARSEGGADQHVIPLHDDRSAVTIGRDDKLIIGHIDP